MTRDPKADRPAEQFVRVRDRRRRRARGSCCRAACRRSRARPSRRAARCRKWRTARSTRVDDADRRPSRPPWRSSASASPAASAPTRRSRSRGCCRSADTASRRCMTRNARRFVGPLTFEAITREPRHHQPVRAGHERRHRAHRARVEHGPAARGAGDREHHRQVRQRHRRRFSVRALSGDARAGAARAGHEHQHVGARRPSRRTSRRCAARGVRFVDPGEGYLACGWVGKGRLAEPDDDRRRPSSACSASGRRWPDGACW